MAQIRVDYSGTTIFVAAGTSCINLGIAEGFVAAGARVAVMSRSKEKVDAAMTRQRAGRGAAGEERFDDGRTWPPSVGGNIELAMTLSPRPSTPQSSGSRMESAPFSCQSYRGGRR